MSSTGYALGLQHPGPDRFLNLKHWALETPGAIALRAAGVQPGEIVALVTRQGPEALTAYLAVAGEFACAPLNPTLTDVEFRYELSRLGARTLLILDDSGHNSMVAAANAPALAAEIHHLLD
jgi:acyl-CoA synthetase (AMP-forming)/AMP-acid ligase II